MKLAVVIQARTRSSRLPGKVLMPAAGRPLLGCLVERVRLAQQPDSLVVATTVDADDDPIVALCRKLEVDCRRGHPTDCLDRHYQVGRALGADAVVKVPSDCPLIDPAAIDRVLSHYRAHAGRYDYVGNLHPATWPDGNDVEVIDMAALERAWTCARDPFDREHTTPFIWSRPLEFRLGNVRWETGLDCSKTQRWVVDWPEDYAFVREVFAALYPAYGARFGAREILALMADRPQLQAINATRLGYSYMTQRLDPYAAAHARENTR